MRFLFLFFLLACQPAPKKEPTYAQAEALFEKQKFIESAQMLSGLLDVHPKLPGARNLLARCFFFLGNPDRSFEELQLVLSYAPMAGNESLDAIFAMGAIALESSTLSEKNKKKGYEAWKLYLKIAPDSELKEQVTAGLAHMKALENPKSATDLARSLVQKNEPQKALAIFERILKKRPDYIPAWHYQGMAFIMSGSPARAVQSWREVLKRDPAYAKKFKLDQRIAVAEKL